ncbi:hypothetical protein [Gloeothece verrucosa]|uniref:hypothetical protein n=1 Tax=Gloeothece verrucosa TaxID=2546359 RepID=UPI000323D44C|nr:hypothetical protein [Gloeothece verrucosa]
MRNSLWQPPGVALMRQQEEAPMYLKNLKLAAKPGDLSYFCSGLYYKKIINRAKN